MVNVSQVKKHNKFDSLSEMIVNLDCRENSKQMSAERTEEMTKMTKTIFNEYKKTFIKLKIINCTKTKIKIKFLKKRIKRLKLQEP